jgi:SAM-dependent methyltransferase
MEQRFTFNAVADLYDAARPSYPDQLFDDVVEEARLARGARILEVGSGTGKATEGFARRGFAILAIEPGAQMIAAARKALGQFGNVSFVETTFEKWEPDGGPFGVVAAAQSWHWIDPTVSFAKAAKVLGPNGVLAVFGNVTMDLPEPFESAFAEIYQRHIPGYVSHKPDRGLLPGGFVVPMFDASGVFGPVTHKAYPWRWKQTAKSYADYLSTLSHHRLMEAGAREAILADVAKAIDARGGSLDMHLEAHLYMAHPK